MATSWIGFVFWRASVLDCGSPLPLLRRQSCRGKSGRGLPHSKTLRNFSDALANHGHILLDRSNWRLARQNFILASFKRRPICLHSLPARRGTVAMKQMIFTTFAACRGLPAPPFCAGEFLGGKCLMANGGCAYMKSLSQRACHDLWIINFMRIASFLAVAVFMGVLASFPASGQETNNVTFHLNWVNVPADKALEFYMVSTRSSKINGIDVPTNAATITLKFSGSLEALTPVLEKALFDQAGIEIKHWDSKSVMVYYHDELAPLRAGDQPRLIILTSQDVKTNSVQLITTPTEHPLQKVLFEYASKSPDEIKAIASSHPTVKIMKDGVEVAETALGGSVEYLDKKNICVGLDLIFETYDEAKLAANTLRGN